MLRVNPFWHDLHILTGAYALDALEDASEQERFARHLRRCGACASEARGLREVSTALAFAAAQEPPPGMRARVLELAEQTRQLPPELSKRHRKRSRLAWPQLPWLQGPWLQGLVTVTAVVAIVAAVVFGIGQSDTRQQLSQVRGQQAAIAAVLAAPDVRTVSGPTSLGGRTTVVLSAELRELVVSTSGLPVFTSGKVYQLWLIGPSQTAATAVRSAGLLPAATSGLTAPYLASGLVGGDKLGITVEPAGGTKQPTTTPIVLLPI
jgi:anti-sigma-K factor RskA